MSEMVFYLVAEDPEKPHVAYQVQRAAMHKHGCENGAQRSCDGVSRRSSNRQLQIMRNDAVVIEKCQLRLNIRGALLPRNNDARVHLEYVKGEIDRNNRPVHEWKNRARLIVAKRKHSYL